MSKKSALIVVMSLLVTNSVFAAKRMTLERAEDLCFARMEYMFDVGEEKLKNDPKKYSTYFTDLNNLSIEIGDHFKTATRKVKENYLESQQALHAEEKCVDGQTKLANKYGIMDKKFARVFDEDQEKSLIDQFLDFLMSL